ncbi:MAG TPA: cytochrome c oxidase subunit 3 [Candidatus Baltobacteraceae bacterium]
MPIRAHPLVFGVVLFLASELMFFAGLFAAYFDLRSQNAVWPPPGVHLDLIESSIGTFLLFASSMVMFLMTNALSKGRQKAAYGWLFAGIMCGIAFIGIALHGWSKNTFTIASSAYGSIFYAMTGFHVLHVTAGVVLLAALFYGLRSNALRANARAGAEAIMYYWHFVFVVWIGIWGSIYLLR